MFDSVMLAWLLELGGAIAVAAVGVGLWSLPPNTPVVGRPPLWVGWIFVAFGVLTAVVSSAGHVGLQLQSPVRRRAHITFAPKPPQATPVPIPIAPAAPIVPAAPRPPMAHQTGRTLTDATVDSLVELARTPNLTGTQRDALLAPYKGKWMTVEGSVQDVDRPMGTYLKVTLEGVSSSPRVTVNAYFEANNARVAALHRGASIRVVGEIRSVYGGGFGLGAVTLDKCEIAH
jgi:hypothetical protein